VLTYDHLVKREHTLVCIVIDGRNVSKTLTIRAKCEHCAYHVVRLWCAHYGKFSRYGKK